MATAGPRRILLLLLCGWAGVLFASPEAADAVSGPPAAPSGGAGLAASAPASPARRHPSLTTAKSPSGGRWLTGVTVTEYWPVPESWFVGAPAPAPGLTGEHRIDWLYSATGVSMQGEGIGLDGRLYHLQNPGRGGWVTASAQPTLASQEFRSGPPYWRAGGYWRNAAGGVTYPLDSGGWSAGAGLHYVPLAGISFAPGPSLPLTFYRSIAVDPHVIPLGSRVYIPAYRADGHGGWFVAQDTGGAINGRRIDVFRPPPAQRGQPGRYLARERVLVIRPKH